MVKATLVVVDDERILLLILTRRLEKLSYKVYPASSGVEALESLQRETVDVLITDFQMPGMDGAELITKAIAIDPMLQSIVVTGYCDLKNAIYVMGAGAFNYLPKPVDFDELDITIQKGLEKRKLLQQVDQKQKQLEQYRHHLEELVEKRTEALTEVNQALRKEIEERKQLEISLREAKVLAEDANKAKSEFLANMSHEIRTPMTSAIGLLNLVLDTKLLPKQKTYLEMARVSTVVMHNLLNDILDFSKIEAGKLTLESISFEPKKVIDSVVDLQHFQAEEKKIGLVVSIDTDVPATVIGDPNRLRQIILNLVSNAIKFSHYGEVVIHCENATEIAELSSSDDQFSFLHISVKDNGIGISKEKTNLIFEAFSQADSSTTREYGGAGLGLNICSKLVAMMGGRIWVVSEPGQGSTFHFTCRLGRDHVANEAAEGPTINRQPVLQETKDPKTLTILLVEDNQSNQWVFRELLLKQDYAVVNVSDGASALAEIAKRRFDLLLLDLQLPGMNGYEVAHQIRKHERATGVEEGQHLPIIAISGSPGKEEMQKCLDAGMNDFIAKPFMADQFFTKVRKQLHSGSNMTMETGRDKKRIAAKTSILAGEIFNEEGALKKACGDSQEMVKRIKNFLQTMPQSFNMLRENILAEKRTFLEQEIHRLNAQAMEIGATSVADELFSLLMNLRNNQTIKEGQVDIAASEFETFRHDPKIRSLLGE